MQKLNHFFFPSISLFLIQGALQDGHIICFFLPSLLISSSSELRIILKFVRTYEHGFHQEKHRHKLLINN